MNGKRWMKSMIFALSLGMVVPGLALAQGTGGTGTGGTGTGTGSGSSGNVSSVNGRGGSSTFRSNNPMPVLIYTVWGLDSSSGTGSGSGVSSSSDVASMVLYDNGLATLNQSNADGSGSSGCSGACSDTVQLSSSQVNQFIQQLRRNGAFRQQSNNGSATSTDTSLTTITVFSYVNGSTSTANTFSFNTAQGRTAQVQNSFSQFFSDNFGSSTINGGGTGSGTGSGGGQ
jgi:hypothetical protein